MKIIDLLNKIAKGEEVPKKIKGGNTIYIYDEFEKDYVDDFYEDILKRETRHIGDILYLNYLCKKLGSGSYLNITKQLNYEVEIIEEDKEYEVIEEITSVDNSPEELVRLSKKINQLIKNQKKIIEKLNKGDDK